MAFSDKILEKSIDPTVHQMLDRAEQAGIETVCLPTARAVDAYNQRCQQGQRTAAGLHLTC